MFLTPNVNAYERNILSTPNGNVHKRRVFRRATQYVKVCGYDKEQWTSQATTQRYSCSGIFWEISGMENFRKFPEISNLIFSFPDWLLEILFT